MTEATFPAFQRKTWAPEAKALVREADANVARAAALEREAKQLLVNADAMRACAAALRGEAKATNGTLKR